MESATVAGKLPAGGGYLKAECLSVVSGSMLELLDSLTNLSLLSTISLSLSYCLSGRAWRVAGQVLFASEQTTPTAAAAVPAGGACLFVCLSLISFVGW